MKAKGYDVNSIVNKVEESLKNGNNNSQSKFKEYKYVPKDGDVVRYVPFKDGTVYYENYVHFLGKGSLLPCPKTVGEDCRVCEESEKLFKKANGMAKTDPDRKVVYKSAFKLQPVKSGVIPVHIKFRMEEKDLKPFTGGKLVYFDFLNGKETSNKKDEVSEFEKWLRDPDYGNITDVNEGHDLTMDVTPVRTGNNIWDKREIKIRPKSSKLAETPERVKEILESVPDFYDVFKFPTYEKTVEFFEGWMAKDDSDLDFPPRDAAKKEEPQAPAQTTQKEPSPEQNALKKLADSI